MKLVKTAIEMHQANLYIHSACKPEWAYELITDLRTAKEDVALCTTR